MPPKLISDFRESAISSAPVPSVTPEKVVSGGIARDVKGFLDIFTKGKAEREIAQAKSFNTALKLHIESNTERIILESENDPAQIKKKLDAFKKGLLENLPESSRLVAAVRIDSAGNVGIAQANKNLTIIQNEGIAADDEISQGNSLAEWKTVNEGLFSENPETANSSKFRTEIILGDFYRDISEKALDQDGNVIISPKVATERVKDFQRIGTEAAVAGWWRERGSTAEDYMDLLEGKGPKEIVEKDEEFSVDPETGISEESFKETEVFAIRKLKDPKAFLQNLENELNFKNGIIQNQEDAADEQKTIDQGANIATAWARLDSVIPNHPPLSVDAIVVGITNETFTPAGGLELLKATLAPEVIIDDQNIFNMISEKLERNEDATSEISLARAQGLLTGKSARSFGTENEANIERDLGVTKGPRKTLVDQERQNLSRNLKTQADYAFILNGKSDPAGARRTSQMMTEFNRRTEDPEVDPVAVQLELSERGRIDTIDDAKRLNTLPLPMGVRVTRQKFIESLQAGDDQILKDAAKNLSQRFTAGNISEQEYKIQRRFIFTWLRTLGFLETAIVDVTRQPGPPRSQDANR